MARKIVVTSGKGGVGKTTVCVGVSARLASMGFRVLMVDVDFGLNNLDVVMGVENKINFDIVDVIKGRCRPRQALVQDFEHPSLFILPSCHSYSRSNVTSENVKMVIDHLDEFFDYIIIDCPAGVENGFHRAVFSASEALIVVTPHVSSVRDANKVLSILSGYDLSSISLIVNRVRGDLVLNGDMLDPDEIVSFLKVPLVGIVPEDDGVCASFSVRTLTKTKTAGRSLALVAENIHTGSKKIYDYAKKFQGVWGAIKNSIKKKL